MNPWPSPYVPSPDPTGSPAQAPSWSRARCIAAGEELAKALVRVSYGTTSSRTNVLAEVYLELVKRYHRERPDETQDWENVVHAVYQNPDTSAFNEHDFANIHRVAWLKVLRALSRLVALNPFIGWPPASNPWADPVSGGTAHSVSLPTANHGDFVFVIPNKTGYYAITNADLDEHEGTSVGELLDGQNVNWPP